MQLIFFRNQFIVAHVSLSLSLSLILHPSFHHEIKYRVCFIRHHDGDRTSTWRCGVVCVFCFGWSHFCPPKKSTSCYYCSIHFLYSLISLILYVSRVSDDNRIVSYLIFCFVLLSYPVRCDDLSFATQRPRMPRRIATKHPAVPDNLVTAPSAVPNWAVRVSVIIMIVLNVYRIL